MNRVTNGLLGEDLGSDRRVAVFAENAAETAFANLGGLLAGASVVPVNFHLTAEEVAYILNDSDTRVLFADAKTVERALAAAADSSVHTVIAWDCDAQAGLTLWEPWLAAASGDETASRYGAQAKPSLHVGHYRTAERHAAAADHVCRWGHDRRAPCEHGRRYQSRR